MGFRKITPTEESYEPSERRFRRIFEDVTSPHRQSRVESTLSSGLKGIIEGFSGQGDLFGGEETTSEILRDVYGASPEQIAEMKGQRQQLGQEALDRALPSKKGMAESLARRGARMIPGFMVGPGGALQKAGGVAGGAILGQAAEESGAGEWGQAAAEILGSIIGGSPSGNLRPRPGSAQERLVNTARRHGLSEREIAPAIQSERKAGFFGPVAHRGRGTVGRIAESRSALGRIYERLEGSPAGQRIFTPQERTSLLNDLTQELQGLPHEVRDRIARDAMDMLRSNPNAATVMDFYRDVNYHIGRGHGHLGGVRRVLENHLTTHLGEDFANANQLFGNVRRLGIRVRPDMASHFHDFRSATDLSEAILKGDKKGIARAVTELVSRFTASKALVSPYMQHIPRKLLDSARSGSVESAKKILTIMLNKGEED